MESISSEAWTVRATAWELAAFSFRHPTRELAEAVACGEWADAACEVCGALDAKLPKEFAEGVDFSGKSGSDSAESPNIIGSSDATDRLFHRLRAEATRLFVGPTEPACSPYEGVWRAKADGVKPLLFVNPHSMEVERFVKACGFTHPEGSNDPLDHIATECELLEALALRAAAAGDAWAEGDAQVGDGVQAEDGASAADASDARLPGGSAHATYGRFIKEHLNAWVADFCNACETETREPFYRAAAQYLRRIATAL